ncbi:MAG: radical SAM protein [Armatimonadota bacterium]|jgi:hypothetical protein
MSRIPIPSPVSGGLLLSYKCSAACRHCMYLCSPQWPGDWISDEDLGKGLAQLAGRIVPSPWGPETVSLNHGLHFSGGEPFLNFDRLLRGVVGAEAHEIPSTFVETNCFWCAQDETTREKLTALRDAGLRGIMISVNPFFAEFVPFERTERCVPISNEVFGSNVFVYQAEYWRQFREMGIRGRLPLDEYVARTGDTHFARRTEMFLMGRAAFARWGRTSPRPTQIASSASPRGPVLGEPTFSPTVASPLLRPLSHYATASVHQPRLDVPSMVC